eukprot:3087928-Pyramimonas_sp.AAC.1
MVAAAFPGALPDREASPTRPLAGLDAREEGAAAGGARAGRERGGPPSRSHADALAAHRGRHGPLPHLITR